MMECIWFFTFDCVCQQPANKFSVDPKKWAAHRSRQPTGWLVEQFDFYLPDLILKRRQVNTKKMFILVAFTEKRNETKWTSSLRLVVSQETSAHRVVPGQVCKKENGCINFENDFIKVTLSTYLCNGFSRNLSMISLICPRKQYARAPFPSRPAIWLST